MTPRLDHLKSHRKDLTFFGCWGHTRFNYWLELYDNHIIEVHGSLLVYISPRRPCLLLYQKIWLGCLCIILLVLWSDQDNTIYLYKNIKYKRNNSHRKQEVFRIRFKTTITMLLGDLPHSKHWRVTCKPFPIICWQAGNIHKINIFTSVASITW